MNRFRLSYSNQLKQNFKNQQKTTHTIIDCTHILIKTTYKCQQVQKTQLFVNQIKELYLNKSKPKTKQTPDLHSNMQCNTTPNQNRLITNNLNTLSLLSYNIPTCNIWKLSPPAERVKKHETPEIRNETEP